MVSYAIILLMLLQLVATFEMNIVMSLAPVIADYFAIIPSTITYLNLGYAFSGFLSPFFGYLSDKKGTKEMIVISGLFFSIGAGIVSIGNEMAYIIGRFILGIGYYNIGSIALVYTHNLLPKNRFGLASGLYKVAFACGAFAAPLLGGELVKHININQVYYIISLAGLLITVLLVFIPKSPNQSNEEITVASIQKLLLDKKAQLMVVSAFLLSIPAVFFYNYASVYQSSLGIQQTQISSYYSYVALGSIIAGVLISIISDKVGINRLSLWAAGLSGVAILFIIGFPVSSLVGLIFGLFYDSVWGVFYPSATPFYKFKASTFVTILSFMTSSTNIVTSITGPILYKVGGFNLLIIICSIGLLISVYIMKKAFKLDQESKSIER